MKLLIATALLLFITAQSFAQCSSCSQSYVNSYTAVSDASYSGFYHNNYYGNVGSTTYSYNGCYGNNCGYNYMRPGCCNAYNNGNYQGRCTGNCLDEDY